MYAAVGALLRRGVEVGHASITQDSEYKMPPWGIAMLATTSVVFIAIMSMIEYTFGRVIPTLIMIESPQDILFEPLSTEDPDSPLDNKAVELPLVKQRPITARFRSTIKLLQSKGGFRARFRGVSIFIVYTFQVQWISRILMLVLPFVFFVRPVVASVLCAQLSLAWTHIVISDPSAKPWYRRVPGVKTWKKVAVPTAILALAEQLAILLPAYLAASYDFVSDSDNFAQASNAERAIIALKAFSVLALSLTVGLLIVIPANVTLTRVQASLLPDNEETIVPFDRTFGGKVIPEIVGGSGAIGMLDAWKSFDWNSRIRLLKAYAKVIGMQIALSIIFTIILAAELFLIVGKDLSKLIPSDGKDGKGDQITIM